MSEPAGRSPFARYRERMAELGFSPRRSRGQNFLLDPSLHRAIAAAASVGPEDLVVEIGAGLGFLTRELATLARRVVAVEIDSRLLTILEEERAQWGEAGARVRLCPVDALAGGRWNPALVAELEQERRGCRRLVLAANLPYSIAGPILAGLIALPGPPVAGAVLVQREMAERLCAVPGSKAYGSLAAVLQAGYAVRLERTVGAEVFRPRPAVDSAVVSIRARPESPLWALEPARREEFAAFVRAAFAQRRKRLRNALARAGLRIGAQAAARWLLARPDALAPEEWVELWSQGVAGPP